MRLTSYLLEDGLVNVSVQSNKTLPNIDRNFDEMFSRHFNDPQLMQTLKVLGDQLLSNRYLVEIMRLRSLVDSLLLEAQAESLENNDG